MNDLRQKIDEAKRRLPLPELMAREGLSEHAKKSAHCPFHDDKHKSFSVFQGKDGFWHYKCFARCGEGDEIMFLSKRKGLSLTKAMSLYLEMAGFSSTRPPKSHEYPKCHEYPQSPGFPECLRSPEYPVSPVSNGQGPEKELEALAAECACIRGKDSPSEKIFELARGVRALEKKGGWRLETSERLFVFKKWHEASKPFLDDTNDYLAEFLAAIPKVRVPKGEGDTINKAIEKVLKLSVAELPTIVQVPGAPEAWRRIFALHCELSRVSTKKDKAYFLSSRYAAKVRPGLSHQTAAKINLALAEVGAIEIVRPGDNRKGGKATEFRC
jgi:hypothetical protein